eukprot:9087656-Pyramimonas_sp.AAC.1
MRWHCSRAFGCPRGVAGQFVLGVGSLAFGAQPVQGRNGSRVDSISEHRVVACAVFSLRRQY